MNQGRIPPDQAPQTLSSAPPPTSKASEKALQASSRQHSQALNTPVSEPLPFMTGGSFALLPPRVAHPPPDSIYSMMNFAGSPLASPRSAPPVALGGPGGMGEMPHFDTGRPPEWFDVPYGGAPAQAHASGFWPQDYTHPAAAYTIGSFASRPPLPPPPPPPSAAPMQQFSDTADHGYLPQLPLNMAPLKGDPNFTDRHGMATDVQSGFSYSHNPVSSHIGVQTTTEQSFETTIAYPTPISPPPMASQYYPPPPLYHSHIPPHTPPHIPPQPSIWGHSYTGAGDHRAPAYHNAPYMPELATSIPVPAPARQEKANRPDVKRNQSENRRSKSRKLSASSSPTTFKSPQPSLSADAAASKTKAAATKAVAKKNAGRGEGASSSAEITGAAATTTATTAAAASSMSGNDSLPPDQIYPNLPMDKICVGLREILEADRRFQNVTEMAHRLKTRRKRLYEAVNVLSEIGFLEKKGYDSFYTYNGHRCLPSIADIEHYVQNCQRSSDADLRSSLRFQVFYIMLQIHSRQCTVLDLTARLQEQITHVHNVTKVSLQTLRRRLYDLIKVLEVFGVVTKQETWTNRLNENRCSVYSWAYSPE